MVHAQSKTSIFDSKYEEIRCVGRDKLGLSWIVKHREEDKMYFARKIFLEGLDEM